MNPDGEIRDTYQHLTKVFEMQEEDFFKAYCGNNPKSRITQYEKWHAVYRSQIEAMQNSNNDMAFSSLWIAQNMYKEMPKNSIIHFGIHRSRNHKDIPVDRLPEVPLTSGGRLLRKHPPELSHPLHASCSGGSFGLIALSSPGLLCRHGGYSLPG